MANHVPEREDLSAGVEKHHVDGELSNGESAPKIAEALGQEYEDKPVVARDREQNHIGPGAYSVYQRVNQDVNGHHSNGASAAKHAEELV